MVTGKPVLTIYARGGAYSADAAKGMDFQKSYLELLLGFIGFKGIRSILVEPTLAAPDDVAATEAAAKQTAIAIAKQF